MYSTHWTAYGATLQITLVKIFTGLALGHGVVKDDYRTTVWQWSITTVWQWSITTVWQWSITTVKHYISTVWHCSITTVRRHCCIYTVRHCS